MKKTIITLLIFLIFITLNFADLKDFYENYLGKISYEKGEFESAEKYFQNSENKKSIYNLAKTFYKQKKYKFSAEKFETLINNEKNIFNFYVNSNLGNVYFKLGEAEKPKENWEKSIEFYREALKIKYDEKVEKNLQFVLDKLNDLKKEENKESEKDSETSSEGEDGKKSGEQKNDSESSSPSMGQAEGQKKENKGNDSETSSPSMGQAEGQKENTGSGKSEDKSGEQKNDSETTPNQVEDKATEGQNGKKGQENEKYELTDEQKVELKKYQDNLKKSELQNSDSFGKVYTENDDFSNFDSIFNDPFFDDPFGDRKTEKKDW